MCHNPVPGGVVSSVSLVMTDFVWKIVNKVTSRVVFGGGILRQGCFPLQFAVPRCRIGQNRDWRRQKNELPLVSLSQSELGLNRKWRDSVRILNHRKLRIHQR